MATVTRNTWQRQADQTFIWRITASDVNTTDEFQTPLVIPKRLTILRGEIQRTAGTAAQYRPTIRTVPGSALNIDIAWETTLTATSAIVDEGRPKDGPVDAFFPAARAYFAPRFSSDADNAFDAQFILAPPGQIG